MRNPGELSPSEARDAAGFIQLMRQLKERSGLTYRELEERAARSGDVLARSTLADILRRPSLPRPDVLAAFVRACGDGQRVGVWLDARDRIAADTASSVPATESGPESGLEPEKQPQTTESTGWRPRWARGRTVVLAVSLAVPLLALVAWELLPGSSGDPGAPAAAPTSRSLGGGWVTIRPVSTPDLCLTDGRDRGGDYGSAVAVQLPCSRATVPRTYLQPAGEGLYRIQWHHPEEGKGCLTIMRTGPVKGMLEPRNDCGQGTLFRVEAATAEATRAEDTPAEGTGKVRLRPTDSSKCIGIADNDTAAGAEAVEERCTGAADQQFLVRAG
ncbi:XRE family transcriptional regulator [Streptomyces sp. NPDC056486]|uniref:XRE family transcriptional regulator n=1 Tax=Streptomyces sp. NPDC056486 TaxID=3345835 RepID=UPI0036737321